MSPLRAPARLRGPLLSTDELTPSLRGAELVVQGRLVDASNASLLCRLGGPDGPACIYKPIAGERPLWDFPDGTLAAREVATYLISESLGMGLVPTTVMRDGPYGMGMVQVWIETDEAVDLVQITRGEDGDVRLTHADHPRLREMAVLDVIINNADRKGSHLLHSPTGEIYGVDHGVSLHVEPKLRTVLWGWAGEQLMPSEIVQLEAAVVAARGSLQDELADLLSHREIAAIADRAEALLRSGRLPHPPIHGPALPWPPV